MTAFRASGFAVKDSVTKVTSGNEKGGEKSCKVTVK